MGPVEPQTSALKAIGPPRQAAAEGGGRAEAEGGRPRPPREPLGAERATATNLAAMQRETKAERRARNQAEWRRREANGRVYRAALRARRRLVAFTEALRELREAAASRAVLEGREDAIDSEELEALGTELRRLGAELRGDRETEASAQSSNARASSH